MPAAYQQYQGSEPGCFLGVWCWLGYINLLEPQFPLLQIGHEISPVVLREGSEQRAPCWKEQGLITIASLVSHLRGCVFRIKWKHT